MIDTHNTVVMVTLDPSKQFWNVDRMVLFVLQNMLECVGHVRKRMGSGPLELKRAMKSYRIEEWS